VSLIVGLELTVCAVVLLVSLAVATVQVGLDLSTNTDAVADFNRLDVLADFDGLAYYLVANANWQWALAPATCVCVSGCFSCCSSGVVTDR